MNVRQKRILLTSLSALLIQEMARLNLAGAFNEVVRTKAQAQANAKAKKGIKNSLHLLGLAFDLLLYADHDGDGDHDDYLKDTESYRVLGEFWEKLHPLCRWGGRFGDGNHFSIEHEGVR